ncbi:MAG TPA: 23S rRNA (adenine(2503)-C(2))-methyltransferase RlmN [Pseudogracilibacillus sp.]|nr:23S rRNA (adenine(2503)-C(2))-methyltransferase RlmN [Pseudogracilibacillus sp.]
MKRSIYDITLAEMTDWLAEHGEQKFRAKQVWDWLYRKRINQFTEMHNVNKSAIELLEEHFTIGSLEEELRQESTDGTVKFLFKLQDGQLIETVLMTHHYGYSVCVTTQVGCNIGCSFCASGILSKDRDLRTGEIVEQIVQIQKYLDQREKEERVSHIVVMGIGEPFDNFTNVVNFLNIVNDNSGLSIGARHITVSTSGLAHKIYEFADLGSQVNLAVSLHAPNNELRTSLMKINRAFPIEKLMDSIDYYLDKTNRRVTFEYILIKDFNDKEEQANELAALLRNKRHLSYVNLIPYNPVSEHIQYERSTNEAIEHFAATLKKQGINCGVRYEQGADIDAACGQLRSKQMKAQ